MSNREQITIKAKEILASCPQGIRFSELVKRLQIIPRRLVEGIHQADHRGSLQAMSR